VVPMTVAQYLSQIAKYDYLIKIKKEEIDELYEKEIFRKSKINKTNKEGLQDITANTAIAIMDKREKLTEDILRLEGAKDIIEKQIEGLEDVKVVKVLREFFCKEESPLIKKHYFYVQIGNKIGCSPGTVKKIYYKGLQMFKDTYPGLELR